MEFLRCPWLLGTTMDPWLFRTTCFGPGLQFQNYDGLTEFGGTEMFATGHFE